MCAPWVRRSVGTESAARRVAGGGRRVRSRRRAMTKATPPMSDGEHRGEAEQVGEVDPGRLGAVRRRRRRCRSRPGSKAMSPPATDADITTSSSWPKLIVSGSSAEQPMPASPNASDAERRFVARAAPRSRRTRPRARRAAGGTCAGSGSGGGSRRRARDRASRDAQNAVSASDAIVVDAPSCFMSSDAQLPFIVSQIAVGEREHGVEPEPRRDARARGGGRRPDRRRGPGPQAGAGTLTTSSPTRRHGRQHGQSPPEAEARRTPRRTAGRARCRVRAAR